MKYVIIGNSTAAIAGIEGIRLADKTGEIIVISAENRHCYGRPLISYQLLGKISKENMDYRPKDFYKNNNVVTILGKKVDKINSVNKCVFLEDGEQISYDKLLVATGSDPFVPPIEGLDKVKEKFTFMTYDDMEKLENKLSLNKNVLVIGAGLIGLKCVEGILDRVNKVTVVDLADRILPSILDKTGSEIVRKSLEERGVEFILNDCIDKLANGAARLKNSDTIIEFDILIVAVGVRPNTKLIEDIGGDVRKGIIVDYKMQTSISDIYAAGDCTEGYDMSVGEKRILALLPNAYMQGMCAGRNMTGDKIEYKNAIPMNAIGFFDCHIITAGIYEGQCIEKLNGSSYKKFFVKNDKLVGFILINDIKRAGIYTSMIRDEVPLSSVNFALLVESPQLMAFSHAVRDRKLTHKV